ncbi:Transcriptional regulatory protein ZraR [bioreactor metagenome]|uniref:Transcriptional regulatory protein ZraR n=1 Tax=bioreactor metagenome TaxID=1076179 RepID=A0A644T2V9_9ZZZZ|nr:sigma-54 dependent transcriptional regulator [Desulfovibrio desulfuricans]MEA4991188.1 sigma-54 dependent transcriptional regulator [Desulfovibrio desulfuricans]
MTSLTQSHILIVDDDVNHRAMLRALLSEWGADTDEAGSGTEAVALSKEQPYDLILMDVQMAGMTGIEALRVIKAYNPAIPILIMTAYSNVENAVEAIKAGAYDYLPKPLEFDEFRLTLDRALDHAGLRQENQMLREQLGKSFDNVGIIGASSAMRKVLETLAMVAPSEATVLIYGESGTGKELFAKGIHANGQHKKGPFVAVNCAALSENLLESELFGHEKGAFTGADRRREGLFAQADKGTIFLDEIGEISLAMQVKLLRVIQEREFHRVGGSQKIRVDVRIVAATNKNLQEEVKAGRFRQDLFFRLNVVTLTIPPLRDRMEDVPLLATFFLEHFSARNNKTVKGFTPGAMNRMMKYAWPGNVRELENAVERSVVLLVGEYVTERELPPSVAGNLLEVPTNEYPALSGLSLEDAEKIVIAETMKDCDGNKTEAAKRLGITRKTLLAKITRYGMAYGEDTE